MVRKWAAWRNAKRAYARTDNRRMTVDRKLTFFTVHHEIHRLFPLYSLVNQDMRTEWCIAASLVVRHEDAALKCISWLIVMKCSAIPISQLRYPKPIHDRKPFWDFEVYCTAYVMLVRSLERTEKLALWLKVTCRSCFGHIKMLMYQ